MVELGGVGAGETGVEDVFDGEADLGAGLGALTPVQGDELQGHENQA